MSKSSTPIKVLRTALKRVQKGWTKNQWHRHDPETGQNFVCMEGAVYGYCEPAKHQTTPAQRTAIKVLKEIIKEKYGIEEIPSFNDADGRTKDEVLEVIKLGIIRLETGGDDEDEDEDELLFLDGLEEQTSGG